MKGSQKQKKTKKNKSSKTGAAIILLTLFDIVVASLVIGFIYVSNTIYPTGNSITSDLNSRFIDTVLPQNTFKDISVSSRALVVYDRDAHAVVYGKNQNLRFSPASTAKIMTAILALEYYPKETILNVPQDIYTVEGSKMGVFPGEKLTLENLLYGLMLPSGNDAAYTIATQFPGGYKEFVQEMNKKAEKLKLSGTHFEDPAGYQDGNYTTAFDLARLAAYGMQNTEFAEIVGTRNTIVSDITGNTRHTLKNLNELLEIPGVTGVKTGFTNEAEGVLVTSFETNGTRYIIVVLRSQDRFADTEELIEKILNALKKGVVN